LTKSTHPIGSAESSQKKKRPAYGIPTGTTPPKKFTSAPATRIFPGFAPGVDPDPGNKRLRSLDIHRDDEEDSE
jgi:hypothetical protein